MWISLVSTIGTSLRSTLPWVAIFTACAIFATTCAIVGLIAFEKRRSVRLHEDTTHESTASIPGELRKILASPKDAKTLTKMVVSVLAIGLAAGAAAGWLWRDRQLSRPAYVYNDVRVLERYDAHNFLLDFPGIGHKPVTTCQGVDWRVNEKMRQLVPVQRLGCKDVAASGWYQFWIDEKTGRRLTFHDKEIVNARY